MSAAIPTDLTCRQLVEVVTDYLEDRLSIVERARFEMHVCACGGCRTYLAQMRAVLRATGRLTEADVPPPARAELLDAFRAWAGR